MACDGWSKLLVEALNHREVICEPAGLAHWSPISPRPRMPQIAVDLGA
jgi:hypothetical protein